jgi:hypothetical protein
MKRPIVCVRSSNTRACFEDVSNAKLSGPTYLRRLQLKQPTHIPSSRYMLLTDTHYRISTIPFSYRSIDFSLNFCNPRAVIPTTPPRTWRTVSTNECLEVRLKKNDNSAHSRLNDQPEHHPRISKIESFLSNLFTKLERFVEDLRFHYLFQKGV